MDATSNRRIAYKFFIRRGPPQILTADRRLRPDRRHMWRGGRRDHDWINRPLTTTRFARVLHWVFTCRRWLAHRLGTALARG
jgi:hypothetical protein